jgi:hypothetical protein
LFDEPEAGSRNDLFSNRVSDPVKMKKTALAFLFPSSSKIAVVAGSFGPSSKVSRIRAGAVEACKLVSRTYEKMNGFMPTLSYTSRSLA